MKTLTKLFGQDRERFAVPKSAQDVIPVRAVWEDGVFLVAGSASGGGKFSKTFR
ncbi:MAG: hypothetical protein LBU32_24510 [Clostridiales bacterium]|jgi:hypothetical protein|nr:hypothetical protein [Clostridiales bacterium]